MFLLLLYMLLPAYVAWYYLVLTKTGPDEPKGPTPFPLLGNIPQLYLADKISFMGLHKLSLK